MMDYKLTTDRTKGNTSSTRFIWFHVEVDLTVLFAEIHSRRQYFEAFFWLNDCTERMMSLRNKIGSIVYYMQLVSENGIPIVLKKKIESISGKHEARFFRKRIQRVFVFFFVL